MTSNSFEWELYSDEVKMNGKTKEFEKNPIPYFKGTIVQLNIKIENLQNEEVSEELEWI